MLVSAILVSLLLLTCGQALVWRRRDNIFTYLQAGIFFSAFVVPLLATDVLGGFDPGTVTTYVTVLVVGAVGYGLGLTCGATFGRRSRRRLPLTFTGHIPDAMVRLLAARARLIAVAALASLVVAFALLGYVPLLAADPRAAKYGIGTYREGFQRSAIAYHFALALASAILPVMLILFVRTRRWLDGSLGALLVLGLLASLNRGLAFTGPLIVVIAIGIERHARAWVLVAGACLALSAGALFNEAVFSSSSVPQPSIGSRFAVSTPDVNDQLAFLQGFRAQGGQRTHGRTLIAGLALGRSRWDPSTYAIRTATGVEDSGSLAVGGLRLPAPVWGYSAFGLTGAFLWSALSGFFIAWGTVKMRRLVSAARDLPGNSLNLVLAYVVYLGTFGVMSNFYSLSTQDFIAAAVAAAVGLAVRVHLVGDRPLAMATEA